MTCNGAVKFVFLLKLASMQYQQMLDQHLHEVYDVCSVLQYMLSDSVP